MDLKMYMAIDPMALILPDTAYLTWLEIHHPHVPIASEITQLLQVIDPQERKMALIRARTLAAYAKLLEEAAANINTE